MTSNCAPGYAGLSVPGCVAAGLPSLRVFSTCPSSWVTPDNYLERVILAAQWSEKAGCEGMLIYTDNTLVDPWLVSQIVIQNTRSLCPLIAIQPVYMHPFSIAKMVASLAFLYGRRVYLNMVAGGFKNDLAALNDTTPHDSRYDRLAEYTLIIRRLLEQPSPLTFEGKFYRVNNLTLHPRMLPELLPGILVSGSSEAGLAAARAMGAIPVKYPEPPGESKNDTASHGTGCGVRVGIVTRATEDEAWKIADERFPEDRQGQITHQLAMKVSDSSWHKRLSEIGKQQNGRRKTYWLHPFENYKTFCPYLVGSYDSVAGELSRYMAAGYRTYILDIPAAEEELEHIGHVFRLASERTSQ
jgi:alkanesulfonate monooxygenase